jgi:hypothetical protein
MFYDDHRVPYFRFNLLDFFLQLPFATKESRHLNIIKQLLFLYYIINIDDDTRNSILKYRYAIEYNMGSLECYYIKFKNFYEHIRSHRESIKPICIMVHNETLKVTSLSEILFGKLKR